MTIFNLTGFLFYLAFVLSGPMALSQEQKRDEIPKPDTVANEKNKNIGAPLYAGSSIKVAECGENAVLYYPHPDFEPFKDYWGSIVGEGFDPAKCNVLLRVKNKNACAIECPLPLVVNNSLKTIFTNPWQLNWEGIDMTDNFIAVGLFNRGYPYQYKSEDTSEIWIGKHDTPKGPYHVLSRIRLVLPDNTPWPTRH